MHYSCRKVYKFLYEAASGLPVSTNLSRKTATMLKELIVTMDSEVFTDHESTSDYLIGKLSTMESEKCYKKRKTC